MIQQQIVVGVDEAGRGALVGEVYAAAVILPPSYDQTLVKDSKQLTAVKRAKAADYIKHVALDYAIATASPAEIDALNIHHATLLAMQRAIEKISHSYDTIWVDGKFCPPSQKPIQAFVGGDSHYDCIAAASILAKTARDASMLLLDKQHPQYGFAKHKGYATKAHREALKQFGVLPEHRRSYQTVSELLSEELL